MPRKYDWYRTYHEALEDKKLETLSFEEHYVWWALLTYSSDQQQELRGTISAEKADPWLLALKCARGDEELLQRTIGLLVKRKILAVDDDGGLTFINFDARQESEPPEQVADRQRRYRERKASRSVTESNADVTVSHGHVTPNNGIEKKRGEGEEKEKTVGDSPTPPTDDPPRSRGKSPAEHIESPAHSVQAECYQTMMEENRQAGRTGTEIVPPDVVRQQCIIMAKAVKKVGPNANHVAMIRRYCRYLIAGRAGPVAAEQIAAGITGWINSGQPAPQPRSNGYVQPAQPPAPVGKYPAGRRATA